MNNTTVLPFDTLRFANSLKEVGTPSAQAERQAELIAEIINNQLFTKNGTILIRKDIESTKKDIIIWLGGIIIVTVGIAVEILSLIIKLY
jgi:hypothetical protein